MAQPSTNGYEHSTESTNVENQNLFEEISIPVPWGYIKGKWWGSQDKQKQPIIAIHGWQDNAGTFDNLAPLIANDIPILCIDLPGHGLSSHYPPGQYYYIFWDGIMIVRRIVKYFNWTKVKLLGHSLGGAISFLYASSFPDEVECYGSLDIVSPSVRNATEMVLSIGQSVDRYLKYEGLTKGMEPCYNYDEMIDIVYAAHNKNITRENCKKLMIRGMQPSLTGGQNTYSFSRDARLKVPTLGFFTIDQVMEFASRIKCRVLNIRGDPGMKWAHPEHYNLVLDKIQESACFLERHVVPGDHHLHLNNAEAIVDIIRKFFLGN